MVTYSFGLAVASSRSAVVTRVCDRGSERSPSGDGHGLAQRTGRRRLRENVRGGASV